MKPIIAKMKKSTISKVCKHREQSELSFIAGSGVKYYDHLGNSVTLP